MKKFRLIAIFAIILTAFLFAQAQTSMALMDETEGFAQEQSQERITSIKQVELFDMQTHEMVALEYVLEDKVTLIAFINPQCSGCKELSSSLTVLQRFLENESDIGDKFQIIGIVALPFVREKITGDIARIFKNMTRSHFDLFVDVDTVFVNGRLTGRNLKFLFNRFFLISYPHFVLIEPNGSDYNIHIVRNTTSYNEVTQLFFTFGNGFSHFMKGLKQKD